jgi:hypothetical protein
MPTYYPDLFPREIGVDLYTAAHIHAKAVVKTVSTGRLLFSQLRELLLGWPPSLVPDGRRVTFSAAPAPV